MSDRSVLHRTALAVAFSGVLAGCGGDGSTESSGGLSLVLDATETYSAIVLASYEDSLDLARELDDRVQALVANPSGTALEAARQAWLDAREPYLQTEVYRFYDGPIDNPDDGPEGLINAWPLDEVYIDYVVDDPQAGIVNDPSVDIDGETLESLNEQGGETNIATGYHAIEFLLWGQDLREDGPGDRPYTDYVQDGTAENPDRRAEYLTTVSSLLVGHLEDLSDAWADSGESYRRAMQSANAKEQLRRIMTGMIVLSGFETGGERLQTALDSGEQEDEHSCFSDNTHRDMVGDVQGVLNVWDGRYRRLDGSSVSGTGIHDVVEAEDPELSETLDDQIHESLDLANALVPPFDREIRPDNPEGNERVSRLVQALRAQERTLEEVFRLFDLSVPAVE